MFKWLPNTKNTRCIQKKVFESKPRYWRKNRCCKRRTPICASLSYLHTTWLWGEPTLHLRNGWVGPCNPVYVHVSVVVVLFRFQKATAVFQRFWEAQLLRDGLRFFEKEPLLMGSKSCITHNLKRHKRIMHSD